MRINLLRSQLFIPSFKFSSTPDFKLADSHLWPEHEDPVTAEPEHVQLEPYHQKNSCQNQELNINCQWTDSKWSQSDTVTWLNDLTKRLSLGPNGDKGEGTSAATWTRRLNSWQTTDKQLTNNWQTTDKQLTNSWQFFWIKATTHVIKSNMWCQTSFVQI